jgi:ABC-type glycerol-3-phosphate transport system substrate-binding protein
MKKVTLFAMAMVLAGMLAAGCGGSSGSGGSGGNGGSGGSGDALPPRDTSTLDTTLLGHWRDPAGNELYFSPDTVTFVAAETGEEYSSGYEIVFRDDNIKTLKLQFSEPDDIFFTAEPSRDLYPQVFFRRPGLDGLIMGFKFFAQAAIDRLGLDPRGEFPFVDTAQRP